MRALSEVRLALRRATPSDVRFIQRLSELSFHEYDPRASQSTAQMMLQAAAQTVVAVREGKPVGFIIWERQSHALLAVNAIAVAPSERGKGVGKRLMQAAERYAQSAGFSRMTLCTDHANLAALDLFLRVGFVIVERTAFRYRRGQQACKLEKRVP